MFNPHNKVFTPLFGENKAKPQQTKIENKTPPKTIPRKVAPPVFVPVSKNTQLEGVAKDYRTLIAILFIIVLVLVISVIVYKQKQQKKSLLSLAKKYRKLKRAK